jgi:hypothetical protein
MPNVPFVLAAHLAHEANRPALPALLAAVEALGAPAVRLLRALCPALYRPSWYAARARISGAAGAYALVYRARLPAWGGGGSVVLKLLDAPRHVQDRCAQLDFHSEVTILESLRAARAPAACAMFDYGLDARGDAMALVLKDYRCSLRQWRAAQPADPAPLLRLYYAVFREVVVAARALLAAGVVHFDLKCDNVLLAPAEGGGGGDGAFWAPRSPRPPFRVVLADFGESKLFVPAAGAPGGGDLGAGDPGSARGAGASALAAPGSARGRAAAARAEGGVTSRARGTDCFKSPEMLTVGGAAAGAGGRAYDRRRRQGAGASSDVWSLGCLLFELVTGRLLFSDQDWLQLVARVTSASMPLVAEDKAALVAGAPGVRELLAFMLVRDPALRPTLGDCLAKLDDVLGALGPSLPPHAPSSGRREGVAAAAAAAERGPDAGAGAGAAAAAGGGDGPPLPLAGVTRFARGLLLAPAGALRSAALREHGIRTVLLLLRPPEGEGEEEGAGGGALPSPRHAAAARLGARRAEAQALPRPPAPPEPRRELSFGAAAGRSDSSASGSGSDGGGACAPPSLPALGAAAGRGALRRVLGDPALSAAAEACAAVGAAAAAVFVPGPAAGAAGVQRWLDAVLPALCAAADAPGGGVLVAAEGGCEGELALLAVGRLVHGAAAEAPYPAMVRAARWGLDLWLRPEHLAAVERWAAPGARTL